MGGGFHLAMRVLGQEVGDAEVRDRVGNGRRGEGNSKFATLVSAAPACCLLGAWESVSETGHDSRLSFWSPKRQCRHPAAHIGCKGGK